MSVAEAAHRPAHRGRAAKLWLALVLLIAAGIGLAWLGAGALRGQTTQSGLYFRTVEEGSGPQIQPVDGVMIQYEGRLDDGSVFDSSAGRGPVPMIAGEVIPGFAEALTMMREGGRYRIRIPSELAYGEQSPPGSNIPPNSDLTFDVEVVQVVPNAALLMERQRQLQGQQQQGAPQPQP